MMQSRIVDLLGDATRAAALARRFAERHPSQARRILGLRPLYAVPASPVAVPKPFSQAPAPEPIVLPPPSLSFDRTATQRAVLIRKAAAALAGFDEEYLRSPQRSRRYSWPRQHAMLLTRMVCQISHPAIGKLYGGRDHTTVMHACKAAAARIQTEAAEQSFHHSLCDEVDKLVGFNVNRVGSPLLVDRPLPPEIIETVAGAAEVTIQRLLQPGHWRSMAYLVALVLIRAIWPRINQGSIAFHVGRSSRTHVNCALSYARSLREHPEFAALYEKSRAALVERWPSLEGGAPNTAHDGTGTVEVTSDQGPAVATIRRAA